jgi:hypothetical protein
MRQDDLKENNEKMKKASTVLLILSERCVWF